MKRFTETEKWRDTWFRRLALEHKLAFTYLCENCDASGVWEPDYELANFCIGGDIDWDAVLTAMGDRVVVLEDGKWYLTRFVEFQNGPLSEACKPHMKIIGLLRTHGIPIEEKEGYHIPYTKGIHTLQERRGEERRVEDREGSESAPAAAPVTETRQPPAELPLETVFPACLDTPLFRAAWADWVAYRRERRLPRLLPKSEAAQLTKLAGFGHDGAVTSIRESISNQWNGLFPPKTPASHANHRTGNSRSFSQQQSYAGITDKG